MSRLSARARRVFALALVLMASLALAPASVSAHVKWFTDPGPYPLRTDLVLSWTTAALAGAAIVALLWVSLAQRILGTSTWPQFRCWEHLAAGGPTQLAVLAAIGLVSAAVRPALLAPNLTLQSGSIGALVVPAIELVVAATFVTGIADWLGAAMLLALIPLGACLFSPADVMEQLHWAGLAVMVLCVGRHASHGWSGRPWLLRRDPDCASRGLALMRILTGMAIVAAACEEKLWNPALGRAFVAEHPLFNVFHSLLGLPVSDDTFVLLMGIAEGTIGVLLASGLLTRMVVLGMWLPFNIGIPFLPPQELLGHLPLFGAMYLLLVHGPGSLVNWRATRSGQLHNKLVWQSRERSGPLHNKLLWQSRERSGPLHNKLLWQSRAAARSPGLRALDPAGSTPLGSVPSSSASLGLAPPLSGYTPRSI